MSQSPDLSQISARLCTTNRRGGGYPHRRNLQIAAEDVNWRRRKLKSKTGSHMPKETRKSPIKFILAAVISLRTIAYLTFTDGPDNKSYYVTIGAVQGMAERAYVRHLRLAGNAAR